MAADLNAAGDPLGLYEYLVEALHCAEPGERSRSHWVMDDEWLTDIRRLAGFDGRTLWEPSVIVAEPDLLLGLPIKARAAAGAPHLETE